MPDPDYKSSSTDSSSLLRVIIWLLVLLGVFACLPGMMSGNYLPKTFWAAATVGLGFALLPPRRPYSFRLTLLGAAWLTYLGWALLSLIWAIQPRVGFERWLVLILPTLAYLLARRTRFWELETFWLSFFVMTSLVAAIGILQYFFPSFPFIHGFPGTAVPRATMGSRNYASMYLMVIIPFILIQYLRTRGWRSAIPLVTLILSLLFLLLTKTRGAWVGLLAGLFYLIVAGGYRRIAAYRKKLLILVIPAFLAFLLALTVGLPTGSEGSFKGKLKFSQAVKTILNPRQRLSFWAPCLGITDPLLGAGFGNFPIIATPYLRQAEVKTLNWEVHNDYLQAYVDLGLPGALLFLLIFALLLRLAWKGRGRGVILAAGASVAGLVVMQFTTFTSEKISTQIWIAGVAAILNSQVGEKPLFRIHLAAWPVLGFNYLIVLWLFLFAAVIGYTIRGDRELRRERDEIKKVLAYQKILDNPDQYSHQAREFVREKGLYDRIKIQNRFNWLTGRILPMMLFDANMRHISCHQFAGLAMTMKDYDAADAFAREALYLHPNDQTSLRYLVELSFLRKDHRQARRYLERGVDTFGFTPHSPYFGQTLIRLDRYEGRHVEANSIEAGMNRNRVLKPASPSPGNRGTDVPVDIVFDWADCNAASSYDLFLWKVGEEEPEYPTHPGLKESRIRPGKRLEPDTTYLWRVRAIGRYGKELGNIWFFRTASGKPIISHDPENSVQFSQNLLCSTATAENEFSWWNTKWRYRTTVTRPIPYRDSTPRVIEVAVDFPLLLKKAGIPGEFDPGSIRVVDRSGREVPSSYRTKFDPTEGSDREYVTLITHPKIGENGAFEIYFDIKDRGIKEPNYNAITLPPENLLRNPGFEEGTRDWSIEPKVLASVGRFAHTTGKQSLKICVDEKTPKDATRMFAIAQKIDVRKLAGQEMYFECDLLAERAVYGAPVSIEIQQFREDGSRIQEYAIQPRWLTLELAEGQLIQFSEQGFFSHEAATAAVILRMKCYVIDADTRKIVQGPVAFFTVWLDRLVIRAAEPWSWPEATTGGFVEGALIKAPLNRGFEFTDRRRLVFHGASEGTLTTGQVDPGPQSVHWGLQSGTLEFWCRPSWNSDDGIEHIFFKGYAFHRYHLQSLLYKSNRKGNNQLEFIIADADRKLHKIRTPATFAENKWTHIAVTWDLPKAHLQLFVDGKKIAEEGPGEDPWPSSLNAKDDSKKHRGFGIREKDKRSIPMQAFIGGQMRNKVWPEGDAAEAVLDEFRISDVVRYSADFTPPREEFATDENTRALWHFENERHGVHGGDDRFVRSYLGVEIPPQKEQAPLDILEDGKVERRMVIVKPYAPAELFETNRGENRLDDLHPFHEMPDPRFIEYRNRRVERTVSGEDNGFTLEVGGDFEPLMQSVTFERMKGASSNTTLLPRWRANDNVVPFTVKSIADTLAINTRSDAEKAIEVMKYANQVTGYYTTYYGETLSEGLYRPRVAYTMLKHLNIYPYDQCGPLNFILRKLFLAVGISSNDAHGTHHQFQQAFFDGSFRLFDLSSRMYWLNRNNTTVLSQRGIEEDPYCKIRHPGKVNSFFLGPSSQAAFGRAERPHCMDFPLRPGENVSICWVNEGRWFGLTGERVPIPLAGVPPLFGNGVIVYEPMAEGEAAELENIIIDESGLRAKDSEQAAVFTYRAQSPYIFTNASITGAYSTQEAGAIKLSLSSDRGKKWCEIWTNPDQAGEMAIDLLNQVAAHYSYWLKIELAPGLGAAIKNLKVRTTFVNSVLSLPGKLSLGENRISFVHAKPTVPVKTTCSWIERHKTDLGVTIRGINYYHLGYAMHHNVIVVPPSERVPIQITLEGRRMECTVSIEALPDGWISKPEEQRLVVPDATRPVIVRFELCTSNADEGTVAKFDVVIREGDKERRIPVEVLVADAVIVCEAEDADEISGEATVVRIADVSGRRSVAFKGDGKVSFDFYSPTAGRYALWLRARWEPNSASTFKLRIDQNKSRPVRTLRMIGLPDWNDPNLAYTKGYLHYPEKAEHWAWYRIGGIELEKGHHQLSLSAAAGGYFDALLLLPQSQVMDRAAMNLFQNWNFAPWLNPF